LPPKYGAHNWRAADVVIQSSHARVGAGFGGVYRIFEGGKWDVGKDYIVTDIVSPEVDVADVVNWFRDHQSGRTSARDDYDK
jgi:hypothetical protein